MQVFKPVHPDFPRRSLLQAGGISVFGLGVRHLDALTAMADSFSREPKSSRANSVIFVFLSGGAAQHDTFDPKPQAPDSVRGEFLPIATRTPGISLSEYLPGLAQRSHLWALCRSLTHSSDDHDAGHQIMLSGRSDLPPGFLGFQSQETNWPSIAALANYAVTPHNNLPPAVVLPEKIIRTDNMQPWSGQGGGLLGEQWDPWFIEAAAWCQRGWGPCPNCYDGVINDGTPNRHTALPLFRPQALTLPEDIDRRRLTNRVELLSIIDRQRALMERAATVGGYDQYAEKAVSLLAGPEMRNTLFDVTRADDATLDRYGRNKYGYSALLAGRLIESGVRLVQVNFGKASSWDTHVANFDLLKNILLPPTDRALSALLDDLDDRGLLETTLVVVASEFGRTPRINNQPKPGRDHWGAVQSVLLAGGGIRGGTVVGSSDRIGGHPASDPQTPENMAATIYQAIGIPRESDWRDSSGKRHQFFHGEPIRGLF